jgi:hypothetical protein
VSDVEYGASDRSRPSVFPSRWLRRSLPPHNELERSAWIRCNIVEDRAEGAGSSSGRGENPWRRMVDLLERRDGGPS